MEVIHSSPCAALADMAGELVDMEAGLGILGEKNHLDLDLVVGTAHLKAWAASPAALPARMPIAQNSQIGFADD